MEEDMIKLSNIMPVELAIARELEYRKKMGVLNNRQMDLKPLVLPQVPASESQTTVDRKRKVEACSAQCSQTLLHSTSGQSSPRFICVTCNAAFADLFNLTMHGETTSHKIKVSQSQKLAGNNVPNPFLCELCDILCSSSVVMGSHVNGLKHRAYLQELERAKRARTLRNLGF